MSIAMRDLRFKPQLVTHYEGAMREIYGKHTRVAVKTYPKFVLKGRELDRQGIFMRDYAYGLARSLFNWVLKRNMTHLPQNIFLGDWASEYYKKDVGNSQFTYINDDAERFRMLVAEEFKIIEYMVQCNGYSYTPFRVAIKEMLPLLSDEWQKAWDAGNRDDVVTAAFLLYEKTYGIKFTTYEDVML